VSTQNATGEIQDSEWNAVNRREKRRRRNERRIWQASNLDELFADNEPYHVSIYTMRFPGIDINKDMNIIQADQDIKRKIGKCRKITKANRNSLLIETTNPAQSDKLQAVTLIGGHRVIVEPHKTLNTVKGVVRSRAMSQCTEEELREILKEQSVIDIIRVKIKKQGEIIVTDTYILTFEKHQAPKTIKLSEWHKEMVDEYVQRPQQCFNCQRFGHVAKYCRREVQTCSRCGLEGHAKGNCANAIECFHCEGPHYANDRKCEKYLIESEIVATQVKERTSRLEAINIVSERNPNYERLYSLKTRINPNDSNGNSGRIHRPSGSRSIRISDGQSTSGSFTQRELQQHNPRIPGAVRSIVNDPNSQLQQQRRTECEKQPNERQQRQPEEQQQKQPDQQQKMHPDQQQKKHPDQQQKKHPDEQQKKQPDEQQKRHPDDQQKRQPDKRQLDSRQRQQLDEW